MRNQRPTTVCLYTLLLMLPLWVPGNPALGQGRLQLGGTRLQHGKPFVDLHGQLPPEVVRRTLRKTRAGGIPPQTVDLTANTPNVQDRNPFWSQDEQTIVFDSDRVNLNGKDATAPPPGSPTHIYKMTAAGAGLVALTGPLSSKGVGANASQREPALNQSGSAVVYVETTPASVDIVQLDLVSGRTTSLIKNNTSGLTFTALGHPEYGVAPGGSVGVIFAGQTTADAHWHIYAVDVVSLRVTQMTFGNCNDRNPTLSPDPAKPVIAFDSDRADAAGSASKPTRDIWVMGIDPAIQNLKQITNFNVPGSENIEPAWSTYKIDQPNGSQHFINGQQLLAFASTRYDSKGDGNADGVNPNGTHDIYWLKVNIVQDPNNPSVFTVSNPESVTNPAYKLSTSDPNHIYDDRKPSWPQFINTYRVAYSSDRTFFNVGTGDSGPAGQPADIFASTLIDLNAPRLIRFDEVTGEIVSVTPKIGSPGAPVTIKVKLADLESGIRDVWLQIKNPNSKYQSSDGKEHKVYLFRNLNLDNSNIVLNVPIEYESQRIFIGADPNDPRVNTYANPIYTASIDDFYAFSGLANPPDEGWLQMQLESRDPQTGIETYTATWTTDRFPSDYYIDVIAYDNALNPFAQGNADRASNWIIYDNVGGFTTQAFLPSHGILFVSDYAEGQKFFSTRFAQTSLVNVAQSFWGTESWMTDIDVNLLPSRYQNGTTIGSLVNVLNALGVKSYGAFDPNDFWTFLNQDNLALDGEKRDGVDLPVTQQYDIWRIQCRGPVPDAVLQQYLPHTEQQPPDVLNGEKNPRTVLVAPRCVIWHSPYTGNLFTGPGTLTDLQVQAQLHGFLAAGGRLFVNGQDVGWALTLDGTAANSFYSNDLHAQYNRDAAGFTFANIQLGGGIPLAYFINAANALTSAGAYNPITHDPWYKPKAVPNTHHQWPGPPDPPLTMDFISNEGEFLVGGIDPNTPRLYGCPGVQYPDVITPAAGGVSDMTYAGGGTALMHYADTTSNSKVVYDSMGIEGLFPDFFNPPNTQNVIALKNRRTEILHNAVCWMRTGSITGTVLDVEAGNPVAGALVRLSNQVNAQGNPVTAYTAITAADGTFAINGVEPDVYEVSAAKAGYQIQKRPLVVVHGGFRSDISFRMTLAADATLSGTVTQMDGTTPVVGATVTATDNLDPTHVLSATTASDGTYTISRVGAGTTYTVTATASGFGSSVPASRPLPDPNDPIATQRDTVVQPAKAYIKFDFKMKAIPGNVTGQVVDGATNAGIANALVTATSGSQSFTATTDNNGNYTINGLDPGAWVFTGSAAGYNSAQVSVTVVTNTTVTAPVIVLNRVPPGSIYGLVTRTSDGATLAGVTMTLLDPSNNVVATTSTFSPATTAPDGSQANYSFTSVPAGITYTVKASLAGYTPNPASQTVAVQSNQASTNVNFQMDPLHTFVGALSLVSAPYGYSVDTATLLGVDPGDPQAGVFRLATWNQGAYVFYPTGVAQTFQLGRGYFMAYKRNLPLTTPGTAADPTQPFNIPLTAGWNLIGDPFPLDIDWTKVQVLFNGTLYPHDQAVAAGLVGPALYSYVAGGYVLDFKLSPWKGYWVRAYKDVTLVVDPVNDVYGRAAAIKGGNSRAVLGGGSGWSLNIQAQVGSLVDADNYLGVSSRAADGFDGFKAAKPPVFGSDYVYLSFDHKNWGDKSGPYGVDVRSASPGAKSWEFTVQTTAKNSTAMITWPNIATVGRSVMLTLTDLATGEVRDMRSASSYTWATGTSSLTRSFRVDAVPATRNQLVISNVAARMQPGRSAGVAIAFSLSAPAEVQVRILNASGTAVRTLTTGTSRAAGVNEVVWDLKSEQGIALPAGVYTIEIRAQSVQGHQAARVVQPILVTR